jgi:hypothetical protein
MSSTNKDYLFFEISHAMDEFEEKEIKETPTVFANQSFNANSYSEILRKSVKGNKKKSFRYKN